MELFILLTLALGQAAEALLLWRLVQRLERGRGEGDAAAAEEKQPDPMDEGFENLMRFSVRGKTGLEREEE